MVLVVNDSRSVDVILCGPGHVPKDNSIKDISVESINEKKCSILGENRLLSESLGYTTVPEFYQNRKQRRMKKK